METGQTEAKGTYLYAVVPAAPPPALERVVGVEQGKVYTIQSSELAAVVSDVPTREELRPERRHLQAHQQVLQRVIDSSPVVLPVSFGTIADDPEGVRALLERHRQDFAGQMSRVEGKVEMRVRLAYTASKPSIFEYLVARSPELRQARDRVVQAGAQATREQKIDLGQAFDGVLNDLREESAAKLEKALGSLAELRRNPPRTEQELVNLACLVPRDRKAELDPAIQSAAGLFPDSFSLEQSGPFPPYDFVDVRVQAQ